MSNKLSCARMDSKEHFINYYIQQSRLFQASVLLVVSFRIIEKANLLVCALKRGVWVRRSIYMSSVTR